MFEECAKQKPTIITCSPLVPIHCWRFRPSFSFTSILTEVPIMYKPIYWFPLQINVLVSIWQGPPSVMKVLKLVSAFFIKFLFFHQMITIQKLWKMFFTSSKKLFSFSRYSHFRIFSLPFHTFQTQTDKWNWNNLWCLELVCINLLM